MKRPDRLATRLSVSFMLLFLLTFAAVVAVTLYYAQRTFQTSIDDNLQGLAATVEQRLAEPGANPHTVADESSSAAQFIEILGASGQVIARSQNLDRDEDMGPFTIRPFLKGGQPSTSLAFHNEKARNNIQLRVVRYPLVSNNNHLSGYVMVASPIPEVDDAIQSLVVLVIVAGVLGMAVAVVGTVWLSRRESRPLQDLTEDVQATAASGFELQIPVSQHGSLEARELREAFAALVDRQRELIDRERAFFADSSHVLRTPLAVLQGDVEQLEQGVYGKERQEVMAQARTSIRSMARTVNGLLLLARQHESWTGSTWEVIELGPLLQRLSKGAQVAFPALAVSCEIEPQVAAAGDPDQLRDLFASLIENACHYTLTGGSVEVSVCRDEADNAVVEIRDTGIGFSAEEAAHVTERFYRGPTARRMFPGGSGLGLAIAKRITTLHHGILEIGPRDCGGTVACVKLPAVS